MRIPANETEYIKNSRFSKSIQWAIDSYNDNHLFNRRTKELNGKIDNDENDNIFKDIKDCESKLRGFRNANKLLIQYLEMFK